MLLNVSRVLKSKSRDGSSEVKLAGSIAVLDDSTDQAGMLKTQKSIYGQCIFRRFLRH